MKARELDRAIGAGVRRLRPEAGLTLREAAEGMGLTYQQVAKYEHGSNRLSLPRLFDLARATKRPAAECFATIEAAVAAADERGTRKTARSDRTMTALYRAVDKIRDPAALRCLLGLARGMHQAASAPEKGAPR
jgi:transcriptional regulator with XRE-family HTH domain